MEYSKKFKVLSEILNKSEKVNSYNKAQEKESETLAHSLLDLESSFGVVLNELLPKLFTENISEKTINEILLDIGEELRHILYHINDPQFYTYLKTN